MGVYSDTLADINAQIDRTEFEIDAIEGTKSMTIYVYQEAAGVRLLIQNMQRWTNSIVYTYRLGWSRKKCIIGELQIKQQQHLMMQFKMVACITFGLKFRFKIRIRNESAGYNTKTISSIS